MSIAVDVLLESGETSILFGSVSVAVTQNITFTAMIQKFNGTSWVTDTIIGPTVKGMIGGVDTDLEDIGTFEYPTAVTGVYRWVLQVDDGGDPQLMYAYFEVTVYGGIPQPTLSSSVFSDGTRRVTLTIDNSDDDATNRVYIRRMSDEFSTTPDFTRLGDGTETVTLGSGSYAAKVVSIKGSFTSLGLTDPIYFQIYPTVSAEETEAAAEAKNIDNVDVEGITNTFFGNQFLAYFLRIPQVGYYQDPESRSLKSYITDRINETIKGTNLPETAIPFIPIAFSGHQNSQFMGVGDGELGVMSIRFVLDRFLQNYTSLLCWSYLKYDWTFGGKNPDENFEDRDLEGILVVEFLDADENRTRKLGYKVIIDSLPGLNLAVDSPEEIVFEASFRIIDVDTSQFVMGTPLHDAVVIHGGNSPKVASS